MKVIVVGTNWGQVHLSAYKALGHEIVAIVDKDIERAKRLSKEYNVTHYFSEIQNIIGVDFDLVSLVVPAKYHFIELQKLRRFNCHIILEKPILGFSATDELYEQLDKKIMINYAYPFLRNVDVFYSKIEELTKINSVEIECLYNNLRPDCNYSFEEYFYETVSHPLSLIINKLGQMYDICRQSHDTIVAKLANGADVRIVCRCDDNTNGIKHRVAINSETDGTLLLKGEYVVGHNWHYDPIRLNEIPISNEEYLEACPWYIANLNSISNLLAYFENKQTKEQCIANGGFDLEKAYALENVLNILKKTKI